MPITKNASKPGAPVEFVTVRSEWPVLSKEEYMPEWYENRNGIWDPSALSICANTTWNEVTFTAYGRRGNALRGGMKVKLDNFEPLIVTLLAHLWDVPEEDLRSVKALTEQVARLKQNRAFLEKALLSQQEEAIDVTTDFLPDEGIVVLSEVQHD